MHKTFQVKPFDFALCRASLSWRAAIAGPRPCRPPMFKPFNMTCVDFATCPRKNLKKRSGTLLPRAYARQAFTYCASPFAFGYLRHTAMLNL
eukprot:975543-Pyramimonas_sp.AAC.1